MQQLLVEILSHAQGMWRYRWLAAGSAWLVSVAGWIWVSTVPDVYRASARVYVDTETLLKPLMQGLTTAQNTLNEVQLVSKAVLTRPNLEQVAVTTDLILRTRTEEQRENLITGLQTQIQVAGGRDNIFTVQYDDYDRDMARDVVAAVLDTFIESARGNEGDDTEVSGRALASEIELHER